MRRFLMLGLVCALGAFGCDDDDSNGSGGAGGAPEGGAGGTGEGGMGGAPEGGAGGVGGEGGEGGMGAGGEGGEGGMGAGGEGGEGGMGAGGEGGMGAGGEGGMGAGGEGGMGAGGEGGGGDVCPDNPDAYPGDNWDACVSDGGAWVLAGESAPSSIARVAAFEQIGDLLWNAEGQPGPEAFVDAQLIFVDDEGIGSRVARRYDSHVPKPEGANCREEETATPYPDYCVGPVQMLPIINAAFDAGAAGEGNPFVHIGRLEGAMLWFLYVSTFKEANTCFGKAKDCDSSWAYFGAGDTAADPAAGGFGAYVKDIDEDAYTAVFNALLAVRCWRDIDDAETAEDEALFQRAIGQLDTALDYAYSTVIISRLNAYIAAESDFEKQARWANIELLGKSLDRAARAQDAGAADRLMAIWESDAPDAAAAVNEIEILFPCP